ncbi:hypothetical protein, partial [Streptomyces flavofungini]|uniref:hypothetical protein n=1 Tax=Streptomyces flavofungini TaxID=68200 RepID=UPI003F7EFEFC
MARVPSLSCSFHTCLPPRVYARSPAPSGVSPVSASVAPSSLTTSRSPVSSTEVITCPGDGFAVQRTEPDAESRTWAPPLYPTTVVPPRTCGSTE